MFAEIMCIRRRKYIPQVQEHRSTVIKIKVAGNGKATWLIIRLPAAPDNAILQIFTTAARGK